MANASTTVSVARELSARNSAAYGADGGQRFIE